MTEKILSLFRGRRKPDEMSPAQRRVYEGAVRQVRARRFLGLAFPRAVAPFDRPENETRRVSLPRRVA